MSTFNLQNLQRPGAAPAASVTLSVSMSEAPSRLPAVSATLQTRGQRGRLQGHTGPQPQKAGHDLPWTAADETTALAGI